MFVNKHLFSQGLLCHITARYAIRRFRLTPTWRDPPPRSGKKADWVLFCGARHSDAEQKRMPSAQFTENPIIQPSAFTWHTKQHQPPCETECHRRTIFMELSQFHFFPSTDREISSEFLRHRLGWFLQKENTWKLRKIFLWFYCWAGLVLGFACALETLGSKDPLTL